MISVSHLTKKYGSHLAVDDISFTVEPGRIYGFLGPNGAGKSTTMNIITGCLSPTEGDVTVNGYSMLDEPVEAKRHIGYLPETPPLYADMTPYEYLRFVAEAKGVRRDKIADEVESVMASTGIEDMKNRLIRNLSKGYRQRVGIAQAMLGDPDIVILDEPTEGLDPQQRTEIRALVRELGRERTVILSSHVLSEVQEICDRLIIISHGKLVANDTMENISSSLKTMTSVIVTVNATAEEVKGVLDGVEGIDSYAVTVSDGKSTTVRVKYPSDVDLRETISFAFSDIRRAVVSMGVEEENLEDIFLRLTNADADAPEAGVETGAAEENAVYDADADADVDVDVDVDVEADADDDGEAYSYDPRDYLTAEDMAKSSVSGGDGDADDDTDDDDEDDDDDDNTDDENDDYKPLFGGR